MSRRTAVLIRCSRLEAQSIHELARQERRTLSGYLLNTLIKSLEVEERFLASFTERKETERWFTVPNLRRGRVTETSILLRCESSEAKRIRAAAQRRDMTIGGFVVYSLRRVWVGQIASGRLIFPPALIKELKTRPVAEFLLPGGDINRPAHRPDGGRLAPSWWGGRHQFKGGWEMKR